LLHSLLTVSPPPLFLSSAISNFMLC
jgi:hypothetical protein